MGLVKIIHISSALLSIFGFFIRGIWMIKQSPWLQQKWVKILPHIVDTVLLTSAITLAVQYAISPISNPWLMAKIIALLLYIYLGLIAMRLGKTRTIRTAAWVAAMVVFTYIFAVAKSKSVVGF